MNLLQIARCFGMACPLLLAPLSIPARASSLTLPPETPAILFSGKVNVYDSEMPADIFLPKGTHAPLELLERIRLLLVRKRGPKRAPTAATPPMAGVGAAS